MSKFSGKCDLYDIIQIAGGFDKFNGTHLYLGDLDHPIKYETEKDLIPYYPHIEVCGTHDNQNPQNSNIVISKRSWVDIEEERYGPMRLHKYYREFLQKEIEANQ